jgi:amino-acid N-acetyltransferase
MIGLSSGSLENPPEGTPPGPGPILERRQYTAASKLPASRPAALYTGRTSDAPPMKPKHEPPDRLACRRADVPDLATVRELLAANDLPTADVHEHIRGFVLATDEGRLIGTVGLECHGRWGLLRSLCVTHESRGCGVATLLCDKAEALARRSGVRRLYLLTTTASRWFERRGFVRVERDEVPAAIRRTAEFRSLCPASAACMTKPLGVRGRPARVSSGSA